MNCPNCGAPKSGAICEYCGTHFAQYYGQAVTVDVERDIIPIYDWCGRVVCVVDNTPNVNISVIGSE